MVAVAQRLMDSGFRRVSVPIWVRAWIRRRVRSRPVVWEVKLNSWMGRGDDIVFIMDSNWRGIKRNLNDDLWI